MKKINVNSVETASNRLRKVVNLTPLQFHKGLSDKYQAKVFLKREDLQNVRSYKIRGAYNAIVSLNKTERIKGVVW